MLLFRKYRFVHPIEIGDNQITVIFKSSMHKDFRSVRGQPVVTVQKLQVNAVGGIDGLVAAVRNTGVLFINYPETGVFFLIFPADVKTSVGTSIINQDDLHILKGLLHSAGETAAEIGLGVINGDNQ